MSNKSSKKESDKKTKKQVYTEQCEDERPKLAKKFYEKELRKLQIELVKLQEWIKQEGLKVVVLFEGRDAAGKGGTIKRITQSLNPRICRVVALGTPTEQHCLQRLFPRCCRPCSNPHTRTIPQLGLYRYANQSPIP